MAAVWAWISAALWVPLKAALMSPFQWFLSYIFSYAIEQVKAYFARLEKQAEEKRQAAENLKKYKEALEKGDQDAIAKAGEDLLNGTRSEP